MDYHTKFMKEALKEAKKAYLKDEIPVGCVVVYENKIISRAHNQRVKKNLVTSHAELEALDKASKKLGSWRLENCSVYVTLEPCSMCAGGIIQARIKNLYFGAYQKKFGACGSVLNLFDYDFNHKVNVEGGILLNECANIMTDFFNKLRTNKADNIE